MKSLSTANKVFEMSDKFIIRAHNVSSKELSEFSMSLKSLEDKIAVMEVDDLLLNDLVTSLRRFRFRLSASPLPFSTHREFANDMELERLVQICKLQFTDLSTELEALMKQYKTLCNSNERPMLDYIYNNFNDKTTTGLIVKLVDSLEALNETLKQTFLLRNTFTIVTPSKLKKKVFFDRLIVLGPIYWYPDHIFNSPRSRNIEIISYDWQVFKHPNMEYLIDSKHKVSTVLRGCTIQRNISPQNVKIEISDQIVDYKKIESNLTEKIKLTTPEFVGAKFVGLTDAKGIFFENHSIKNIWTLSLNKDALISRCSLNELETDSYLLVRTGSGKDIVQMKANEILGDRSEKLREHQLIWKKRLRKILKKYPIDRICRYLTKHGGIHANEINLKNWASDDSIRPREYNDFLALMKLVKLEKYATKLWQEASLLLKAHIKAGKIIRKMLLDEIQKVNIDKLELEQKMVFRLPDSDDATLTAYKIQYISSKIYNVEPSQVRVLIDLYELRRLVK